MQTRAAGQQAQDHDPLRVADHDGRGQQRAQRGTGQGERRPAVDAEAEDHAAGREQHDERAEPEVPERQDDARPARRRRGRPGRRGRCRARRPRARTCRTACPAPGPARGSRAAVAVPARPGRHDGLRGALGCGRRLAVVRAGGRRGPAHRCWAARGRRSGWCRRAGRSPSGRWRGRGRCRRHPRSRSASRTARRRGPGRRRGCPGRRRRPRAATRWPSSSAVTRTTPPAGLCRDALSSRLATSWCSRAGSAVTVSVGRRDADVVRDLTTGHPRLGDGALEQLEDRHLGGGQPGLRRRRPGPGRAGRRPARTSRSAWSSAVRRATGSGSATPSTRFSSTAHRAASGVRSSWLTLATSSRRWRSTARQVLGHAG